VDCIKLDTMDRRNRLRIVFQIAALGAAAAGCGGAMPKPLSNVTAITAGGEHACALLADQTARCWGNNSFGEVGPGTQSDKEPMAVTVPGLSGVTALAAGGMHTCALLTDGTASCWGENSWGQVGNGSVGTSWQITPGAVVGLTGISTLTAMGPADEQWGDQSINEFNCALLTDGTVQCWGQNLHGELGLGASAAPGVLAVAVPSPVVGVSGAVSIGLGSAHACAVLDDGSVSCWGSNFGHTLGSGGPAGGNDSPSPVLIAGLAGPAAAVTGGSIHTCALLRDGTVECWGTNILGQLGNGGTAAGSSGLVPAPVSGIHSAAQIASGAFHTCALLTDGTVWCWGDDLSGELGDGAASASAAAPVLVKGVSGATSIAASANFTCALLHLGEVQCWGDDSVGQLGDGAAGSSGVTTARSVIVSSGG